MVRLYVMDELAAGLAVRLAGERAHYLRHVLRLLPGAGVRLFNGRQGEWLARIEGFLRDRCDLTVAERLRPQAAGPDLWLLLAPLKRSRIDLVAEKATELGVAALLPVWTRHTAVTRVNVGRLGPIAVEAAEQCGRLGVPEVREPVSLDDAIARWPKGRRLLVCAEGGPALPIADALAAHAPGGAWAVLVGPEGGWARPELDGLVKLPFVTAAGLGPRLLRAETAALAALACWQAILGDGRERPPRSSLTSPSS